MRIIIHDYAGHTFQIGLSRELALRGHQVQHQYCASVPGPKGDLATRHCDPPGLSFLGIELSKKVDKSRYREFIGLSREHGRKTASSIGEFKPDIVVTANTPLEAIPAIKAACKAVDAKYVFYVQDLIGVAVAKIIGPKVPVVGSLIGDRYKAYERKLISTSDHVVIICDDFLPFVGTPASKVTTVENWASIEEIPVRPKVNDWSKAHALDSTLNLVYTGTLGRKHNPGLLLRLAQDYVERPDVRVVVVSEGESIEWLRGEASRLGLANLVLLPFQPAHEFPSVLGSADVLVAVLEPDAGVFSVPSKVLSYLCSSRPILLGVPAENLAARIVVGHKAGLCASPLDEDAFSKAARRLVDDPGRATMGHNGRAYAEDKFPIVQIVDRFEALFSKLKS